MAERAELEREGLKGSVKIQVGYKNTFIVKPSLQLGFFFSRYVQRARLYTWRSWVVPVLGFCQTGGMEIQLK